LNDCKAFPQSMQSLKHAIKVLRKLRPSTHLIGSI